tara:strand:+ start:38819 stop:39724 length:906 start_codon:yes stop_codon:yes gene_type:complete
MLSKTIENSIIDLEYPEEIWLTKKREHETHLSSLLDPYLEKRSRQVKDPVLDFLFEYYPFRPAHLKRWSPGIGRSLLFRFPETLPEISELILEKNSAFLNPVLLPNKRVRSAEWIVKMLKNSSQKKPLFGCFGMHEWAMVYRTEDVRHEQIPLRLSDEKINEFVESRPLLCTHFDAFRFFTDKAKPMNKNVPDRDNFEEMEQPGCIHTNMDLYKWSFKLYPWISGELLKEAFLNAVEARRIDMQASPYDVRSYGLDPIRIETEDGRLEYVKKQMEIYEESKPIRKRLISELERVIEWVSRS